MSSLIVLVFYSVALLAAADEKGTNEGKQWGGAHFGVDRVRVKRQARFKKILRKYNKTYFEVLRSTS
jgi:hypothetical protein